jgi:uncharacterized membrane protein (UPF0136 family)
VIGNNQLISYFQEASQLANISSLLAAWYYCFFVIIPPARSSFFGLLMAGYIADSCLLLLISIRRLVDIRKQ